jgi:hypothetical protein
MLSRSSSSVFKDLLIFRQDHLPHFLEGLLSYYNPQTESSFFATGFHKFVILFLLFETDTLVDILLLMICLLRGKICALSTKYDYTDYYLVVKQIEKTQP